MNFKKGFFLTVLAMVMLAFMLVSISWWSASVSEQEARSSERFRAEAVKSVIMQISDDEVSRFANISAFFALSKLAEYSANTSALPQAAYADPSAPANSNNPATGNVNASIYELINYGTATGHSAGGPNLPSNISYTGTEMNYTFSAWAQSLSAAVQAVGYRLNVSQMRDFSAEQVGPYTVRVRFSVDMNLTDETGSIRISRTAHADSNLSIEGLLDPMIYRGDISMNRPGPIPVAQRQIYHIKDYAKRDDVKPIDVNAPTVEGKGWFYGPVTDLYPQRFNETMNASKIKSYILKTTYDGLEAEANATGISIKSIAESYGGVLLANKPNETITFGGNYGGCDTLRVSQDKCFDKSVYYLASNTSDPDYPNCTLSFPSPVVDPTTIVNVPYISVDGIGTWFTSIPQVSNGYIPERHLLFQSKTWIPEQKMDDPKKIYNIEALRDMAVCGFYVQSPDGPSYFQRMVNDPFHTLNSSSYGIETFVVGQWAGGGMARDPEAETKRSRVDRPFYAGIEGQYVRGMMGCKSREMCSQTDAVYNSTGHFAIDASSRDAYGMKDLMCDNPNFASCN